MDIKVKNAGALIQDTTQNDDGPGTFEVVLSDSKLDRDGDVLLPNEWELPLPSHITFVNDHDHNVGSVVGSATPTLEGDKIVCRGTYARTQAGQDTRMLVKDRHLTHVSVAYREKRDRKSNSVSRELINGSFVVVPSNTNAKVLASKSFGLVEEDGALTEFAKTVIVETVKATLEVKGVEFTKSILPDNFLAETELDPEKGVSTLHIKDGDGNLIVSHQYPAQTTTAPSPPSGGQADQVSDEEKRSKALALAKAQASQFQTKNLAAEGN